MAITRDCCAPTAAIARNGAVVAAAAADPGGDATAERMAAVVRSVFVFLAVLPLESPAPAVVAVVSAALEAASVVAVFVAPRDIVSLPPPAAFVAGTLRCDQDR